MHLIVSRPSDISVFRFIDPRNSIPPILDALDTLPPGITDLADSDGGEAPLVDKADLTSVSDEFAAYLEVRNSEAADRVARHLAMFPGMRSPNRGR